MQGSLVGQSQQTLRAALKVITAIGGNDVLWLATSNSISGLSGAMRSRFTDTFFFDLPTAAERKPIWKVWLKKLGLTDKPYDGDEGWVGRDIRKACEKAWTMNRSIDEVAKFVVPVASIEREEIARLRDGAHDRYLSAQRDGVYKKDDVKRGRARINLDS
jgi:SpoVK/Ycf46/Vps4 family AAA+-type ATPase